MKKIILILIAIMFIACGEAKKEKDQTTKAIKNGMEILKDLPNIQKEIATEKEKRSSHKLSGVFSGNIDGQGFKFDEWQPTTSRGSFYDGKATFQFYISQERNEFVSVILSGKTLFDKKPITNYSPTQMPYDMANATFLKKFNNGFTYIKYRNGSTGDEWSSADGDVNIKQISKNQLEINWNGKAFMGEWQNKNLVTFNGSIKIDYNFLTDYRNQ